MESNVLLLLGLVPVEHLCGFLAFSFVCFVLLLYSDFVGLSFRKGLGY